MEATLIFPVFLLVCVFLVYIGLFQYDRCLLEQKLRYTLIRSHELSKASAEEKEEILKKMLDEAPMGYDPLIAVGDTTCEANYMMLNMQFTGEMPVPMLGITEHGLRTAWNWQVSAETENWEPVVFIRLCNRLKGDG